MKFLDVGCGTGKNIEVFSEFGKSYGVDSAKVAVEYCKRRGLNFVIQASATKLPFKSNYFDVVFLLDVLEHTDDLKALREVRRVVKDGGLVVATVPAHKFLWSKWDVILNHKRRYSRSQFNKNLIRCGLTPIYTTHLYSFLLIPAIIIRMFKSLLKSENYTSDFELNNNLLNKIFLKLSNIERTFALKYPLPFGTSILSLSRKSLSS